MPRDDRLYLRHLVESIQRIEEFVAGHTRETFLVTPVVQDAVIRQIELIGEASRNLSEEFLASNPQVPWHDVIAMRNRLVHAYFDVDLTVVWEVVTRDLPVLKAVVLRHLDG